MLNPPGAQELLDMAGGEEQKLTDPHFRGNRRYRSALITRARDIARRETAQGPDLWRRELELFRELYGPPSEGDTNDIQQSLYTLNTRLAADLRARHLSETQQSRVMNLLQAQVRAKLTIYNPKYLDTPYRHE